jgi:NAD(P)-dependent dehydrogenase (short-subunit alcohol dehydrogenase family)
MKKRFAGKVAWITGGGSGIGRALAHELAVRGAIVCVSGRRADRLDMVAAEINAGGGTGMALECDVTDEESTRAAVAAIVAAHGHLDVAVANAGMGVVGKFEKLSSSDWRRQLDINVMGVVHTAQAALPELRKSKGRLCLVGSVLSYICIPRQSAYAASKFAVRAIGLTLSQELAGSGVSCTTIHPGFVESELGQVDNSGNFDGSRKDVRPQQFMWSAQKAAKVMATAIRRRKREHVFTSHGKLGAFVGNHLPGLTHMVMTRGKR